MASLELPPPKPDAPQRRAPLIKGGSVVIDRRGGGAFFSMGEGTLKIPMAMHATHRRKLCSALSGHADIPEESVILLQGGDELPVYDTDTNFGFRQESNFQYLFGVKEPGCFAALRVADAHAILFVPRLGKEYQAWMGPIKPPAWFQTAYGVEEAHHVDEIKDVLQGLQASELLVFQGDANRDSGSRLAEPSFDGISVFVLGNKAANQALWDTMNECRLTKTPEELKIMQYVNDVSSAAHIEVMRAARPGVREYVSEATFRYHSMLRGCFRTGYDCICPSGRRNAILHYGHPAENNVEVVEDSALRLQDMGAEYHCYSADVTCTWPVAGKFSPGQRLVYEAVWDATLAVEETVRPGVCYKSMHRLAQRVLLERMTAGGLFKGDVEEMVAAGLIGHFMPHGLGHCLGLDVHDVGGYAPGTFRRDDPSIRQNLRLGRELVEGMVITVEPGFYFVDYLIEEALADERLAQFINQDVLHELWAEVGGIRIEDDVVVTATGCRVLTCVPRTCEEIEAVMAGANWAVSQSCCREYGGRVS